MVLLLGAKLRMTVLSRAAARVSTATPSKRAPRLLQAACIRPKGAHLPGVSSAGKGSPMSSLWRVHAQRWLRGKPQPSRAEAGEGERRREEKEDEARASEGGRGTADERLD
jgi:hypothetical protein